MWIGGARAIVLDEKNRILLVKHNHDGKEIWMPPGGGIEDGESASEAAAREVMEETGLDVDVKRLLWHVEEVSDRGQRFVNFFLCEMVSGDLVLGEDPEFGKDEQILKDVRFMTCDEVKTLENVYPDYIRDEVWDILDKQNSDYDAFKMR